MGTLVDMQQRAPAWALARLNRMTGLTFSHLPASLLVPPEQATILLQAGQQNTQQNSQEREPLRVAQH